MTSTNVVRLSRRLPLIEGILDDTIDQAIRVRQRRVMMAVNSHGNLGALRVPDNVLDRLVQSLAISGADAMNQLDERLLSSSGSRQHAAAFVRIAVAVQRRDPTICELVLALFGRFPDAVREAMWFFPVPSGPFIDDHAHIIKLFASSDELPQLRLLAIELAQLRLLAIELAGRRDVKALQPGVELALAHPDQRPHALLALIRMGICSAATKDYLANWNGHDTVEGPGTVIELLSVHPSMADDGLLKRVISLAPGGAGEAWGLLACRHPRATLLEASASGDCPEAARLRIVALTGYMDGIIAACALMTASPAAIDPVQADILELALGGVPVEARCEPNDPAAKSKALRESVLRACRAAHFTLRNDADICEWRLDAILAMPEQVETVRFREGVPMHAHGWVTSRTLNELTHATRQLLFTERAFRGGQAFALSASDVARRQELAMMVVELVDDLTSG